MGMLTQFDSWLTRIFNPGALAVDPFTHSFGVPTETFTPSNYGDYLAASAGVYVCVKKRATLLASLPLHLGTLQRDGTHKEITAGPLYDLTRKVNPWWTWRRLIEMTEMSLGAWGTAYWYVNRGESGMGKPRELFWMRPDRMKVFPHPRTYVDHFEYQPPGPVEPLFYRPSEIVWLRYPNPLDEYSGLSPLAAARLAADTQSAAMKANRNLFANGIMAAGALVPTGNTPFTDQQAKELSTMLDTRMKGVDKAHRIAVLRIDMKHVPFALNPKDAEYVALHKLTLEDIARAYGVPLDLIGGQRTFENYGAALKAMWTETIIPEAAFLADELTEQLLPMFRGAADVCHFDHSDVEAVQADHQQQWQIASDQISKGAITVNEWRAEQNLDEQPWGDVWWAPLSLVPIDSAELPETPAMEESDEDTAPDSGTADGGNESSGGGPNETDRALSAGHAGPMGGTRIRVAYDSDEHQRLYRQFVRVTEPHEARVKAMARQLFRQQEQSLLTELGKTQRVAEPEDADSLMAQIFSIAKWRRRFREVARPVFTRIAAAGGQDALDGVTVGAAFDVADPLVARVLERRAQRFAVEVNETTWTALKASLAEGLDAGEGTDVLKGRVKDVMGNRIRSSAEVIARTETISVYSAATAAGWRQSGVVNGKEWLASLDDRTRETHVAAHGQIVALDADFEVGGSRGPSPGNIAAASESVNCRCSMLAVLALV